MNKATEILMAKVPEPLRSQLIAEERASGRTTRMVDALLQELMVTGVCSATECQAYRVLCARMRNEHPNLPISRNAETRTVTLLSPEPKHQTTRQALLTAARGLGAMATGEQIAEMAGAPRTSINYYFGSLADLKLEAAV